MICKNCGKLIEPSQHACPNCGYVAEPSEKGNGFWDMASVPQPKTQHVTQTTPTVTQQKAPAFSSKKATLLIVAGCVLALCSIVMSIVLFIISSNKISKSKADISRDVSSITNELSKSISSNKQSTDEQVGAIGESIDTRLSDIDESIDSMRSELDEVKGAVPSVLRIMTSPVDQEVAEGYTSDIGTYLFTVEVQGQIATFKWEKQSSVGTWTEIEFDLSAINASFGFMLQEDAAQGYSRLIAIGITPEASGTYKCIITGNDGVEKELYVRLTVTKGSEPSPTPFSESSAAPETFGLEDEEGYETGDNATPVPIQPGCWRG